MTNSKLGTQTPASKNIVPCSPKFIFKNGINLSITNAHTPKTKLQNVMPNSRKFSGRISEVTARDNVEIPRDCDSITSDKLTIEIHVNASTS